jgi:hypothetical protein
LQNDQDEDFIDTYKAAIIKDLAPPRARSTSKGVNNSTVF